LFPYPYMLMNKPPWNFLLLKIISERMGSILELWYTSVIPATWEVVIGGLHSLRPAWAKVTETLCQKQARHTNCNPSYSRGRGSRITVCDQPRQRLENLSENKLKAKGLGLWIKWQSTSIATRRPQLNPQKRKRKERE
jgi:hypothetical protein